MEPLTSVISVQVDKNDKEVAEGMLKNLGLNMNTYVNMAIKQLINKNDIPFEIDNPKPSKELLEALREGEDILSGKIQVKGYHNIRKMFEDILNEN